MSYTKNMACLMEFRHGFERKYVNIVADEGYQYLRHCDPHCIIRSIILRFSFKTLARLSHDHWVQLRRMISSEIFTASDFSLLYL